MYVIPREGYVVRDPTNMRALPPHGANVTESVYWHQRLRDGDVTEGKPPAEAVPVPPAAKE
jgi:uncharacterized protein DUF2635